MADEESCLPTGPLTASQLARIDYARRDLEYARSEDLAQLGAAGLILLVERLRNRLHDSLNLIDEISPQHPSS